MEMEKAELLKRILTFDTTEPPRWVGDVGKCFVDAETETVTIVGWREEMGSPINNYRLVVKPKPDGVSLVGYSDTSKPIKFKVLGISMDEALSRMLRAAENGSVAAAALAQTVVDPSPQYCDTEPRPVGRPTTVGGKRVQVYLDEASLEIAAKIGKSNTSEGIRVALKQAATTNSAG
jgi:hypothetical protein